MREEITSMRTNAPTIGFVSTYPPTECGIATFTFAIRRALAAGRVDPESVDVVALVDDQHAVSSADVACHHLNGDVISLKRTVDRLNTFDVVVLEHEYGIYGGPDGDEILQMVELVRVPTIVVLHTIPVEPSGRQRVILESLVADTDRTVVMSQAAAQRLKSLYRVDASKIQVIQHGANAALVGPYVEPGTRPVVLSWGLIGPGKGLETAIKAVAGLKDLDPQPRFLVLGDTHPKVKAVHGDSYLDGLKSLSEELGIGNMIEFDQRYLATEALARKIREVDLVLIPYDSKEQATSGVLVEAVTAGKPIVATRFPHAVEMLASGAGISVPQRDADAMSTALRTILTDRQLAKKMAGVAASIGSGLLWPVIAEQYESLIAELFQEESQSEMAKVS